MGKLLRGRYEPLEVVGRGGQGEVVKALDHQHDRLVSLKIRAFAGADDRKRLLGEARMLLGLQPHRSLPIVREDFFIGKRFYMVLDWIEGQSLDRVLAERGDPGLPPSSVLQYLADAASALDHLHAHDPPVVHQDVKPPNLIRTPARRVVLVDFGIANRLGAAPGVVEGSRWYAAPELAAGEAPTPAVDVYGLAVTALVLLTGSTPEGGKPVWTGMPQAGVRAIRRGLSTDARARFASAGEFVAELRAALEGTPARAKPQPRAPDARARPIRLILVDDHPVWREAMRTVLEHDDFASIVAEASDGEEAVASVAEMQPDVVLMDLNLPSINGAEATRRIVGDGRQVRVLVLSASGEEPDVIEAVKAGASGYLLKNASASEVIEAVRKVHGGEPAFTPSLAGLVLDEFRRMSRRRMAPEPLSPEESEVLLLSTQGLSYGEIAERCGVDEALVGDVVRGILDKLQIQAPAAARGGAAGGG